MVSHHLKASILNYSHLWHQAKVSFDINFLSWIELFKEFQLLLLDFSLFLEAYDNSRWTEKKIYAQDYEHKNLYVTSCFKLSFTAYSNWYLDHKDNRGFLVGYMAYGDQGIRSFLLYFSANQIQGIFDLIVIYIANIIQPKFSLQKY